MSKQAKHIAQHTKETPPRHRTEYEEYDWQRDNGAPPQEKKGAKKAVIASVVAVCVLLLLAEAAYLVFDHFYGMLNYSSALTAEERAARISSYMEPSEEADQSAGGDVVTATEQEITDIHDKIQAALAANGGSMMSDADVINILLVGSDARSREEWARSDVMLLVSLSKETKKIVLTSFMRDIYCYIPDYGYNRLNTPNAIAGPEYLMETLEANFGLEIDNYAAVNFYDFADVIDTLGGVDVEVTNTEVDYINKFVNGDQASLGVGTGAVWLDYPSDGVAHLNGTQTLSFCRNRTSGGDESRTDRQRAVIAALIEKARKLPLTELYDLANSVLPMVTTDLTKGDCLSLLLNSAVYLGYEIESIRIPAVDSYLTMINGMSVISVDFESNAAVVKDAIYG